MGEPVVFAPPALRPDDPCPRCPWQKAPTRGRDPIEDRLRLSGLERLLMRLIGAAQRPVLAARDQSQRGLMETVSLVTQDIVLTIG